MDKFEEIFCPPNVQTVEELIAWLVNTIEERGGDISTLKMLNVEETFPNIQFAEEWACMPLTFDFKENNDDDKTG